MFFIKKTSALFLQTTVSLAAALAATLMGITANAAAGDGDRVKAGAADGLMDDASTVIPDTGTNAIGTVLDRGAGLMDDASTVIPDTGTNAIGTVLDRGAGLMDDASTVIPDTGTNAIGTVLGRGIPGTGTSDWHDFDVMVPAGTRFVGSGDLVGVVSATAVKPASLPVALPAKAQAGLIYVFDAPEEELDAFMQITFPNVSGLEAGDAHLIYVYDTGLGAWAVVGTAVVSADGSVLTTGKTFQGNQLGYHFVDERVLFGAAR